MKLSVSSLCRGLLATAFAIITLTAASAADSFEGRVHMEITSSKKKESTGIDYSIKDGMMRVDIPQARDGSSRGGALGGMIMDFKNQEMIILMEHDGQKNFMRRSIATTMDAAQQKARDGHQPSVPVATGRTEIIAGYPATEYRTTSEKGEVYELWLAKGLGSFMSMSGNPMGGRGAPPPGWEGFARDGNFFPLRVVTLDAKGNEKGRMEVTKIDKTSLPDSLFSTDGYTEFKMPSFGDMFKH